MLTSLHFVPPRTLHAITLWAFCGFFVVLDRFNIWSVHKISRDAPHLKRDEKKEALDKRAIAEQVLATFVVAPMFLYFACPYLISAGIQVNVWHFTK